MTRFRTLSFCAVVLAIACSDSPNNNTGITLTNVDPASATACAAGGVTISTGADTNKNGVLDDTEVASSQNVCNSSTSTPGMPGFNTLSMTTMLPVGDLDCVGGGTRIDLGVDNGAGGGTASDNVLQTGEITSTQFVCNGSTPDFHGATTPSGAAGAFTIDARGGSGTTFNGGDGGTIDLVMAFGSLGGHIKIFNAGSVDATFAVPTWTPTFGSNALVVSADLTLHAYANSGVGLATADELFLVTGDPTLYRDVAGVAVPVTGLDVLAGYTLTVERTDTYGPETAVVFFPQDIRNAGTIKGALRADNRSRLHVYLSAGSSFLGVAGSTLDASGLDGPSGNDGGSGGIFEVYASGHVVNQGTLQGDGGDGDAGGGGGEFRLSSGDGDVTNTGVVFARGGAGLVNGGGNGGQFRIYGGFRDGNNSGAVDVQGGTGASNGGTGGTFGMWIEQIGSNINSGAINASGGPCTDTNCSGGLGGSVHIGWNTHNGDTLSSGAINLSGADGKGTGDGGSAGALEFTNYDDNFEPTGTVRPPTGSIRVSGNLNLKGGNGISGGDGGSINAYLSTQYNPQGQEIAFYGYTQIDVSGGDSTSAGGDSAGYVTMQINNPAQLNGNPSTIGPAGSVINYANIIGTGGSGVTGVGDGGYLDIRSATYAAYFNNPYEFAANFGALDFRGGNTTGVGVSAADGGRVYLFGRHHTTNEGSVNVSGGNATGDNASGGAADRIELYSVGPVTNKGAVTLLGGSGGAVGGGGGNGGSVNYSGSLVTNTMALTCNGGAAGLNGGNGGTIEMTSVPGTTANTGALSISGGAATNPGAKGSVTIDGSNQTP